MKDIDKAAMGKRIRQIRLGARLRQWELAKLLGTTQSAVHKYEHGVVPEPRRLVELAQIGGTSIEWVLTGRHWENGSEEQARLRREVLDTAALLREIGEAERATLREALEIIREAIGALQDEGHESSDGRTVVPALRDHAAETLRLLESAWRVQKAVLDHVVRSAGSRLDAQASGTGLSPEAPS